MSAQERSKQLRKAQATEMYWVIDIPPEEWLDTFYPGGPLPSDKMFDSFEVQYGREAEMYGGLVKGFNGILDTLGNEEFVMRHTGEHPDTTAQGSKEDQDDNLLRPDLALYSTDPEVCKLTALIEEQSRKRGAGANTSDAPQGDEEGQADTAEPATKPASNRNGQARTVWAAAEFFVEAKARVRIAPFWFNTKSANEKDPLPPAMEREEARGQIIDYARQCCFRQHRCSIPIISVYQHSACFVRVDRAGAVVSAPFDYVQDPKLLATFVYRYVNASREGRGFDPTALPASESDHVTFERVADDRSIAPHIRQALVKAVTPGWPIHKLSFEAQWSHKDNAVRRESLRSTRTFLVGRPAFFTHSMAGRGTRGFVGWDVERESVVFIKDYWRADLTKGLTEYEVYLRLSSGAADGEETYIPTLLGGGDVVSPNGKPQKTATQNLTEHSSPSARIVGRVHTRLVFKEVCRNLRSFKDARELASAVYGALKGHQRAWEKHGLLHRDLSVWNILIHERPGFPKPEVVGLLSDWDLAKDKEQVLNPQASQATRSGTWQFMSAALLNYPVKPHVLSDDLESVFHVLNWCALKYLPHNLSGPDNADRLKDRIYNLYNVSYSGGKGSADKLERLLYGVPFVRDLPPNHPFDGLLRKLSELFKTHYERVHPRELAELVRSGDYEKIRQLITISEYRHKSPNPEPAALSEAPIFTASFGTPVYPAISLNDDPTPPRDPSAQPPPLNTHDAMLSVFHTYIDREHIWPDMEKLNDQVPDSTLSSSSGIET